MLKLVWRELSVMLFGRAALATVIAILFLWSTAQNFRPLPEAFAAGWWFFPFLISTFLLFNVWPSLVSLRALRAEFNFDPIQNGDSRQAIARALLDKTYPQLLRDKREGALRSD